MLRHDKLVYWTQRLAVLFLLLLIVLCIGWELWWAPLRSGGSFMVLKALPLLLPLRGLLHGRRYTMQWTSMFILLWLAEGSMRVWSDHGVSQALAALEMLLATALFFAAISYAKLTGKRPQGNAG